jgi:juvenile hormone acid methyltransferase
VGDDGILSDILIPKLPPNFKRLTCVDVCQDMLLYARDRCNNSKLEFVLLDIGSTLPESFHQQFDHIFSFYCLHWVPEQKQAMGNLFDMLRPGGAMLLSLAPNHWIFDIHEKMAESTKWRRYMDDIQTYSLPYRHCANPAKKMERHLKESGFTEYVCELVDRSYTHPNFFDFWKWTSIVNTDKICF